MVLLSSDLTLFQSIPKICQACSFLGAYCIRSSPCLGYSTSRTYRAVSSSCQFSGQSGVFCPSPLHGSPSTSLTLSEIAVWTFPSWYLCLSISPLVYLFIACLPYYTIALSLRSRMWTAFFTEVIVASKGLPWRLRW